MPKNAILKINLLPKDDFNFSILGRVLGWALSTFRVIVVLVEFIVMSAFLSRFWLDTKNSDLSDELEIKSAQIEVLLPFEESYRLVQKKILLLEKSLPKGELVSNQLKNVLSRMPPEVFLDSLGYDNDSFNIAGIAPSEISVIQFITNLKADQNINSVKITKISYSDENEGILSFTLKVNFRKETI